MSKFLNNPTIVPVFSAPLMKYHESDEVKYRQFSFHNVSG
jgi:hypothetical protein